ncbi:MAG: DUF5121 domain-containing protein [Candidatus Cryptobacteroides sp.]
MKVFSNCFSIISAGLLLCLSCVKEPADNKPSGEGPEMNVDSYTESTYMGAKIKVTLSLADKNYDLSTLNAALYYGESEVASTNLRTKTEGQYEVELQAPLLKNIPDGTAQLVLKAQNVGMGTSEQTLDITLKRPDFDTFNLVCKDGKTYIMNKVEGYRYEVTGDFPAHVEALLLSPEFADKETVRIGWADSALSASSEEYIPFGSGLAGQYSLTADLMELTAAPTGGSSSVVSIAEYKQGQVMDFGSVVDLNNWYIDPDFFDVSEDGSTVTFRAVDGLYRMSYDVDNMFIKVEPMADKDTELTLSDDGSGAVWVIGSGFGKPVIGPAWNTTEGAYAAAQVEPKVYEFTLAVPSQLAISGSEVKLYHQKGWGGEFKKENYAQIDLSPAFNVTDDGNIHADNLNAGKAYRLRLDLRGGTADAKISYEEFEVKNSGLDITVNGVKALKLSENVYKVVSVAVEQNSIISFSGIENPLEWTLDQDHFTLSQEGLKFNAISGYYSFELNLEHKYVIARHVKSDGKAGTYRDEGAITFMGWGVGYPAMAQQIGFENGLMLTLAQIEKGVYQFTGVACEDNDATIVGNCWRYNDISFKFFGQAGWGDEWGTVTLTDEAKKYLDTVGNVELIVESMDGDKKVFKPLEKGATYRMTVTECSACDGDGKFNVTIDFRKL